MRFQRKQAQIENLKKKKKAKKKREKIEKKEKLKIRPLVDWKKITLEVEYDEFQHSGHQGPGGPSLCVPFLFRSFVF